MTGSIRIIFVPGMKPKPPERIHRQVLGRCMRAGLERVDPDVAEPLRDGARCLTARRGITPFIEGTATSNWISGASSASSSNRSPATEISWTSRPSPGARHGSCSGWVTRRPVLEPVRKALDASDRDRNPPLSHELGRDRHGCARGRAQGAGRCLVRRRAGAVDRSQPGLGPSPTTRSGNSHTGRAARMAASACS